MYNKKKPNNASIAKYKRKLKMSMDSDILLEPHDDIHQDICGNRLEIDEDIIVRFDEDFRNY